MDYKRFKAELMDLMVFVDMNEEDIDEDMNEWYIMFKELNYPTVKEWAEFQFPPTEVSEKTHNFWLKSTYHMELKQALEFFEFEKLQKQEIRGGVTMYDVKGYHKYLTMSELIDHYFKR